MKPSRPDHGSFGSAPAVIVVLAIAAAQGGFARWIVSENLVLVPGGSTWTLVTFSIESGAATAPLVFPIVAGSLWITGLLRQHWLRWAGFADPVLWRHGRPYAAIDQLVQLLIALAVSTPIYNIYSLLTDHLFGWGTSAVGLFAAVCSFLLFLGLGLPGIWIGAQLAQSLAAEPRGEQSLSDIDTGHPAWRASLCCFVFLGAFFVTTYLLPYAVFSYFEGRMTWAYRAVAIFVAAAAILAGVTHLLRPRAVR